MRKLLALFLAALVLAACSSDKKSSNHIDEPTSGTNSKVKMEIHSSTFSAGERLPDENTCAGAGNLPPLAWSGVPAKTAELALVVTDPDAPGGDYLHLAAFGLDPTRTELQGSLPEGARLAKNGAGKTGWTPPCPPAGSTHHYRFTLVALGSEADISGGASIEDAYKALKKNVLARATLVGTYSR
jgi:Raf kinase inhibitor-like YbhB/YbcL family protein